jgi:hypothetical protein
VIRDVTRRLLNLITNELGLVFDVKYFLALLFLLHIPHSYLDSTRVALLAVFA